MAKPRNAEAYLPEPRSLAALREAVQECRGCDLDKGLAEAGIEDLEKVAGVLNGS